MNNASNNGIPDCAIEKAYSFLLKGFEPRHTHKNIIIIYRYWYTKKSNKPWDISNDQLYPVYELILESKEKLYLFCP